MNKESKIAIQAKIISEIIVERDRQDTLWGEEEHILPAWTGIIGEEFGELCQAINETFFNNGNEKRKLGGYENLKREGIHAVATLVKFLEFIERHKDIFTQAGDQ